MRWQGQHIAFLDALQDDGQTPIAQPQPVQPLDEPYPIEYAMPRAMNGGSFTMTIRELWAKPVWQHLQGLQDANDLLGVWQAIALLPGTITCQTIIKPPSGGYWRLKTYHNVIISDIDDSESVSIGQMTVPRQIRCMYTHATRQTVTAGT